MQQELFVTADGSHSLRIPELNVSYHSKYGAIQEALHIFIGAGLHNVGARNQKIAVLEVGFGTGLNALLTLIEAKKNDFQILYDVVELHPVDSSLIASLNYLSLLEAPQLLNEFSWMHSCDWNVNHKITSNFNFRKIAGDIRHVNLDYSYDLIYYDPFDPAAQPHLWTADIFRKIYDLMNKHGVLVTYSCKGEVRRDLRDVGFRVTKVPGPAGKREISRAVKL